MTEKTYICNSCWCVLDTFEKDEQTVVVFPCAYCREQEATHKRLNVDKGQINTEERMLKYNADALGMVFDRLGVRK